MFVVAGVSGHTGRVVAETLLSQKQPIRVIVRDAAKGAEWKAKGAEVAVASLDDSNALAAALSGARGAYLLVPPQYGSDNMLLDQARVVDAIASAVKLSRIPHVVALSSVGAAHSEGTGPIRTVHRLEKALEKSALHVTFLRASYFLENHGSVLGTAVQSGVFHTFLTLGRAIPMVATLDIGRTAAALLLESAAGIRVVDLAGPADLTPEQIAALVGELSGRDVQASFAPLEYVVPAMTAAGVGQNVAELLREMIGGINTGIVALSGPPAELRRGTVTAREVLRGLLETANA